MCMWVPGAPDSGAVSLRFVFAEPLSLSTESPNTEIPSPAWAPHTEPSADKHTNIQFHFCQKRSFPNHKYPSASLRQDMRVCCGSLTSTRFWSRSSAMSFSSCLVCSLSCMLWAVISFWACTRSSTVTAFTPSCERGSRGVTFSTDAYISPIWKCWLGSSLGCEKSLTSSSLDWKRSLILSLWVWQALSSCWAWPDNSVCLSCDTREKLNNNVMTTPWSPYIFWAHKFTKLWKKILLIS